MSTFVSVGNATQPFLRLLEVVTRYADLLPQPLVIQYGHSPPPVGDAQVVAFVGADRFVEMMRGASLVILHGGAGSMLHAIKAGRIPVVMPRLARYGEHVDDHQVELVEALDAQGKVVWVREGVAFPVAADRALKLQELIREATPEAPVVSMVREALARLATRP